MAPSKFKRPHHQRIADVLQALNGPLLREHNCLFAGGTAITLRYGEYRESVDIDFLVSDIASYRSMRQMIRDGGLKTIIREGAVPPEQRTEIRSDQYGIRTQLAVADITIKFEIVFEGRIQLAAPGANDSVCGIATLTPLDMATSKLLANSDRWPDDSVFSRDVIDLAMMQPTLPLLRQAVAKAEGGYGETIRLDLGKAIDRLQERQGWMERCMQAMAMDMPKAVLWKSLRSLRRVL